MARYYKNYKRAVETEAEREIRLETDRKYHELKKQGRLNLQGKSDLKKIETVINC
jgi:hypothetical protein